MMKKVKNMKKIKKVKKKKKNKKEKISIYYVSPYSLRMTIRYEIEIYRWSSLDDIVKAIRKRADNMYFCLNVFYQVT